MIEVRNLTKTYGNFVAVNGISFKVDRGEVVGFLGPNGAGKTTTIRILTCFHPSTAGTASVAGYDVFSQSMQVRQRVGYLPESAPLYPELRVREYLRFRGKLRGMTHPEIESGIRRVADRCWLGDFIDRPIAQLSKGMRQRVGLADAIMHDPDVLVLDEPTIGLDPTQIRETRSLIKELGQRHTILLSSHILSEVAVTCSRIIIIVRGVIRADGSLDQLSARFGAGARVVAEMRGPIKDVEQGVRTLEGVDRVHTASEDGWVRVAIEPKPNHDVREDVFKLTSSRGWSLREIRREGATLEDYYIRVIGQESADGDA